MNQKLARDYGVNGSFEIDDFNYGSDTLTNLIFSQVERTAFGGITVNFAFLRALIESIAFLLLCTLPN